MEFRIVDEPIDPAALAARLTDPHAGACVTFEGWVRDHNEGRTVRMLEYEAFAGLAEKEGRRILEECRVRFSIVTAACVHRQGRLALGDLAVWVGISAAHRGEAFAACRYVIDEVKERVPIWKKEHYADADSGWLRADGGQVGGDAGKADSAR